MVRRLIVPAIFLVLSAFATGQGSRVQPPTARELPFTPPRKWALVVGANEYTEMGRLKFAAKDAVDFAKTLKDRFEFQPETIETITDIPGSQVKPTVENVTQALDRQLADPRLKDGDLFIFYFSGHGVGTPKGDFLMPTNATMANAGEVGLNLKEIVGRFVKAGLRNVLIIVDACRAGEKNSFGDDLRSLGRQANIAVLLGCEPGTRSYEYEPLGHGAFTNFLLKALKSGELLSEVTGALWASKVSQDVSRKVRDYTIRDYPDKPQTPTGWAEATMDVLLGAFPSKGQARLKLGDIIAESARLPKDVYLDALDRYGEQMFLKDRYADAAEVWRTVDGVRKLGPESRFELAMALYFLGRTLEMDNEFAKLLAGDRDDIYTHLSVLVNPSRKVTPKQRVGAAKELWKIAPTEWTALAVWPALQIHAPQAETNEFLGDYLKLPNLNPRQRLFFEGYAAGNLGQWAMAQQLWEKAILAEGEFPDNRTIQTSLMQALALQGKAAETEAQLKRMIASGAPDALPHFVLAEYYKGQGRMDAAMAEMKIALDKRVRPEDLLWALRIAGLRFPEIADQVGKRADEMPFVWRAMLAKVWVEKLKSGFDAIASALQEATKFCDDEFAVLFEVFRLLDDTLYEVFERGDMSPEKYSQLMIAYSAVMAANVEQFGYDADAWSLFNSFAIKAEKYDQVRALFDLYLGPRVADGTLDSGLRASYMLAAMQYGDLPRVEQIWKLGGLPFNERTDSSWVLSMFYASRGDLTTARRLTPTEPPSAPINKSVQGYRAYLAVVGKQSIDLAKAAKELQSDFAAMQWIALAHVHQGDWSAAMPILEKFVLQRQAGFIFLQAKACEAYFSRLVATKQISKANEFAYKISISGLGNPLYRRIHYGPTPIVANYAGAIAFRAAEFDGLSELVEGPASISITKEGKVKGEYAIGGVRKTIEGIVDAYGNLRATISGDSVKWTMLGKIPPLNLAPSIPALKAGAFAFVLLDAKGQSKFLMGRLK